MGGEKAARDPEPTVFVSVVDRTVDLHFANPALGPVAATPVFLDADGALPAWKRPTDVLPPGVFFYHAGERMYRCR